MTKASGGLALLLAGGIAQRLEAQLSFKTHKTTCSYCEMAASLNHIGHFVTIIDRSSRLMSRQLDSTASALLHEEVINCHIDILYNDEVKYLTVRVVMAAQNQCFITL